MEVVYAVPHQTGFGIKAGNDSQLENAEGCYSCGNPGKRRRKFLYLGTVFDDKLLVAGEREEGDEDWESPMFALCGV